MSSGYLCHCMSFILMWCSAPVHSVLPHQGNSLVHNLSRDLRTTRWQSRRSRPFLYSVHLVLLCTNPHTCEVP